MILADAVNSSEALLDAVGVPGQVVIHHEVGPLEVDAFASGVGGQQNLDVRIVPEGFLGGVAILTAHAAVDHGDGLLPTHQAGDPALQIVQGVPVFGEDNQLLLRARGQDEEYPLIRMGQRTPQSLLQIPAA